MILPDPFPRAMHHRAIESLPQFVRRHGLEPKPTVAREYNPAIAQWDKRLVMAWRIQDERGLSRIVISPLDKNLKPTLNPPAPLDIPGLEPRTHVEDPRLVVIGGELLIFVATVRYGATFTFIQRAFALSRTFKVEREIPLPYGKNGRGTHEKNWMPYERADGTLGLVYQVAPELVVIDTAKATETRGPGIKRWRWGTVSGRTNAIRLDGIGHIKEVSNDSARVDPLYLCLIGGHQKHPERMSEYWVAACIFADGPEPRITGVSREPILWASSDSPALLNPFDPRWNPLCVFPAGLVRQGDDLLVSLGVNDSYCALMRFSFAEIMAGLVPPSEITGNETLKLNGKPTPATSPDAAPTVRVRSIARQPIGEPGGPYMNGAEWLTTPDRASALGKLVEVVA